MTEDFAASWNNLISSLGKTPTFPDEPEARREVANSFFTSLSAQWPEEPTVTSRQSISNSLSLLSNSGMHSAEAKSQTLPVGVFYHGGGWTSGNLDTEDAHCRIIARSVPCVIVAVDFRLAPAHVYPTILNDCVLAFDWAYQNYEMLRGDPYRYFTIGGSSGGNLAINVACRLVATGKRQAVQGIVAIMPMTCHPESVPEKYRDVYKSLTENADAPMMKPQDIQNAYRVARVERNNAVALPVLSSYLRMLPPVWIATSGKDPLRDDGRVLESILNSLQSKVKRVHYEGLPHYFHIFPRLNASHKLLRDVVDAVEFIFSSRS